MHPQSRRHRQGFRSAETVASKLGLLPEQLFKTLAVQGDRNGIYLAVISSNEELDFKALAHQTEDRNVEIVPLKKVQAATGCIRGGATALACKKDYPVYIDELAQICAVISVSASAVVEIPEVGGLHHRYDRRAA